MEPLFWYYRDPRTTGSWYRLEATPSQPSG
jgi:hypothetical protein